MPIRGIRGATTAPENTREAILASTRELLQTLITANDLRPDDIASAVFSVTSDLDAAFPACAARDLGWSEVALLDARAPQVQGDLERCIRVLVQWNTDRAQIDVRHAYLNGARGLRPDRAQPN